MYILYNISASFLFFYSGDESLPRMFYACAFGKRVLVSIDAARLAGPASNFASHGGPFNEERLEKARSGSPGELLMKQKLKVAPR